MQDEAPRTPERALGVDLRGSRADERADSVGAGHAVEDRGQASRIRSQTLADLIKDLAQPVDVRALQTEADVGLDRLHARVCDHAVGIELLLLPDDPADLLD